MSVIYITGDTHGEFGRFSNSYMRKQNMELRDDDYVIICGDFGLCWAKDETFDYNCKNFAEKKYTTLWIQGNHENYDMIEEYPIEEWHGGKVRHIVKDKVILLERGQVFEIDGKTFFTFGGAASHDIQGGILDKEDIDYDYDRQKAIRSGLPFRIKHESWWEQELPNEDEMNEGKNNLVRCGYKVDYVLTHCCATSIQMLINEETGKSHKPDVLTDYLQEVEERLVYKHWFFGHYHRDFDVDDKHTLLYHAMIPVDEYDSLTNVPVPGRPKYRCEDMVRIKWDDIEKVGKVCKVDAFGTFEQKEEPSYDILVEEDNCIYKHICESDISGRLLG